MHFKIRQSIYNQKDENLKVQDSRADLSPPQKI